MSETTATEVIADAAPASAPLPRPRIRVGAALWGLVLTAIGAWTLWMATDRTRREGAREAVLTATPLEWTVTIAIVLGSAVALTALASLLRHLQHPRSEA